MKIEVFAEKIKGRAEKQLGNGCRVTVRKEEKNNGVFYTGLCITKENTAISPVIYLDDHYEAYEKGRTTLSDVTDYVVDAFNMKKPEIDMKWFLNYGNVKGRIVYKLINTDRNQRLLEDVPHMEFLDLSIVFRCMAADENFQRCSILIHNAHLKLWGVSAEELYRAAEENTPRLCGYEFKDMMESICEHVQEEFECGEPKMEPDDGIPLYVLSNKQKTEGAACILYPQLMKRLSDAIGSSFYIIPSSLHEVLILAADSTDDSGHIREMIKEINDTQLKAEEILSYSLYYYDRNEDEIGICQ